MEAKRWVFQGRALCKRIWVRVVMLPLKLWGKEFFKREDDACGDFVAMDVDTVKRCHLQWAKILVSSNGRRVPGILHTVTGLQSALFSYGERFHHGCQWFLQRRIAGC